MTRAEPPSRPLDQTTADTPVTAVIVRRVIPGREAAFEVFMKKMVTAAQTFPGHLGTNIFTPTNPDNPEYRIITKFDSRSHYDAWNDSLIRAQIIDEFAQHVMAEAPRIELLTGLETWFNLPDRKAIVPPPKHKMAVVIWLSIFPLTLIINYLIAPYLGNFPLWLQVLISTLIMVPTMTYFLMPQMTRLFGRWLYPA